jgi:hypothetical protein
MISRDIRILAVVGFLLAPLPANTQQIADSSFVPAVAKPAFPFNHPHVLFDEAHHNFHTMDGRYAPFVELLRADGYRVVPNRKPLTRISRLRGNQVLVIANALGPSIKGDSASLPAFLEIECQIIEQWVRLEGGSLLLVADHAPFGSAAEILSRKFGVDMSKGYTVDSLHSDVETRNPGVLVYSRASGMLIDHPITTGHDSTEGIHRVIAFTGQSLSVPRGAIPFLKLSSTAVDLPVGMAQWRDRSTLPPGKSAAGRAQGVAFEHGKGRVVVLGEAAMLSAQILMFQNADGTPGEPIRMGMNRRGTDNQQLALNVLHWLTRALN